MIATRKRLYLDLCCFNRPFDDQSRPMIICADGRALLPPCRRFCPQVALAMVAGWYEN